MPEKNKVLKEIYNDKNEITHIEYYAIERIVEVLCQTIIDISVIICRDFETKSRATNKEAILCLKNIADIDPVFIED